MKEIKVAVRPRSLSDEEMKFIKQIGVEYVDVGPEIIIGSQVEQTGLWTGLLPGFRVERLDIKNVSKVIKKIRAANLDIASFVDFPPIRQALMGKHGGEKQLEDVCNFIELLGAESIPVTHLCLEQVRHGPSGIPGRYRREHRGGYQMDAFSLELMRKELAEKDLNAQWAHHFKDKITPEEYFSNCVKALERVIPVAEDSGVKLMIHTDDPPIPDSEGILPGITNPLLINRLFDAAPSKNLGLLFCCGTRYESGVNIYDQIRLFSRKNKIFHVHLRNVRGTLPNAGGYEEVALDDGDMDMFKVLKTLKEAGYKGVVNPDHIPILVGDTKGRASLAFAVGYIKALISELSL
jgi:mannonate dehydratase